MGDGIEYIRGKAKEGNAQAIKDLAPLDVEVNGLVWDAYFSLSRTRSVGAAGSNPIQISEILAYFKIIGMTNNDQNQRVMNLIISMDQAHLAWHEKNRPKK